MYQNHLFCRKHPRKRMGGHLLAISRKQLGKPAGWLRLNGGNGVEISRESRCAHRSSTHRVSEILFWRYKPTAAIRICKPRFIQVWYSYDTPHGRLAGIYDQFSRTEFIEYNRRILLDGVATGQSFWLHH